MRLPFFISAVLSFLLIIMISCGNDNDFNPCPKGEGEMTDSFYRYYPEFYDEPLHFNIYPSSVLKLGEKLPAAYHITAEQNVITRVVQLQRADTLILDFSNCVFTYHPLEIAVQGRFIQSISCFDTTSVRIESLVSRDRLYLNLYKQAEGFISAEIDEFGLFKYEGGGLEIGGNYRVFLFHQNGADDLDARNATIKQAQITHNGIDDIYLGTVEKLLCNINGSGNIYYSGEPEINSKINGTGKLIKVE